jgi:NADPH2:quinone reductase
MPTSGQVGGQSTCGPGILGAASSEREVGVRAFEVTAIGGSEVLELRDVPPPEPAPGALVVAVEAAGVNFRDVYERNGIYPTTPPFRAGVEGAGRVTAVGDGVGGFRIGERVAWSAAQGSYADEVLVPAAAAVRVPDAVPSEIAAAVFLQGLTAHYLACSTYPVAAGETVVVHAAAGGVGLLLTQVVKLRGGRVLATTSDAEKGELARGAGADEVVGYDGFADRVRELTGGAGADAVFDGVGRATFDESLRALRRRGAMVLYGAASGAVPPVDPILLQNRGSLYLTRPSLQHYIADREELEARAGELFSWVADGRVSVRIGARFPLEQAREAQDALEARRTTGKVLLVP